MAYNETKNQKRKNIVVPLNMPLSIFMYVLAFIHLTLLTLVRCIVKIFHNGYIIFGNDGVAEISGSIKNGTWFIFLYQI